MAKILVALLLSLSMSSVLLVSASYDSAIAMYALYFCKASYCDAASISAWNCIPCSNHANFQIYNVHYNTSMSSQAFTGYDSGSGKIIVAFRGTSNVENWWTDFHFDQESFPDCTGCKVHVGFWNEWKSYSPGILSDVNSLMASYPGAPLLVTGHSLGAAVSLHAAVSLTSVSSDIELYNFGEPRVGNPAFAAWVTTVLPEGKQYRVTHKKDPVPHVPPMDSVLWTYLHAPHELWYDNDGDTTWKDCADSATAEDPNCSDSIIPDDVANHLLYLGIPTGCDAGDAKAKEAFFQRMKNDRSRLKASFNVTAMMQRTKDRFMEAIMKKP